MTAMRTPGPASAATPRFRPRVAAGAGRALGAALRRFARDTRAAAGIATAMLTIGVLGGGALIVDHLWLYDQRDVLKTAAEAASTAAILELAKNPNASDADLKAVARRYIVVNLAHLPSERLTKAKDTLTVDLCDKPDPALCDTDRALGTVKVTATANLGGTLFSRYLPLLGNYKGPGAIQVKAGVDSNSKPAEVVLAIDISTSMKMNLAGDNEPPAGSLDAPRIEIVKKAASNLVDIIKPDADNRGGGGRRPLAHPGCASIRTPPTTGCEVDVVGRSTPPSGSTRSPTSTAIGAMRTSVPTCRMGSHSRSPAPPPMPGNAASPRHGRVRALPPPCPRPPPPASPRLRKTPLPRAFSHRDSETPISAWTLGLPISPPPACDTRPATRFHPAWMQHSCANPAAIWMGKVDASRPSFRITRPSATVRTALRPSSR